MPHVPDDSRVFYTRAAGFDTRVRLHLDISFFLWENVVMSNTARKARKRNGEKFVHPTKEGTPIFERMVPTVVDGGKVHLSQRVIKRRAKQLEVLGFVPPEVSK